MVYVCAGLRHCYKAGLVSHQDLKPANIFLEDLAGRLIGRSDLDIYTVARVADFGMANASIDSNRLSGCYTFLTVGLVTLLHKLHAKKTRQFEDIQ